LDDGFKAICTHRSKAAVLILRHQILEHFPFGVRGLTQVDQVAELGGVQTLAGHDGPSGHLVVFVFHHDCGWNNEKLRRDPRDAPNSRRSALSLFDPTAP
jgi:hypothetical protein